MLPWYLSLPCSSCASPNFLHPSSERAYTSRKLSCLVSVRSLPFPNVSYIRLFSFCSLVSHPRSVTLDHPPHSHSGNFQEPSSLLNIHTSVFTWRRDDVCVYRKNREDHGRNLTSLMKRAHEEGLVFNPAYGITPDNGKTSQPKL